MNIPLLSPSVLLRLVPFLLSSLLDKLRVTISQHLRRRDRQFETEAWIRSTVVDLGNDSRLLSNRKFLTEALAIPNPG